VQGVQNVKSSSLPCKYIFIAPPSIEELEMRLRNRATESEESILVRLENASNEMKFGETEGNFDAFVTNADLEAAFSEIVYNLQYWYPHFDFGVQ
jgi:guanylate kinase